jgi:hypothetical protein
MHLLEKWLLWKQKSGWLQSDKENSKQAGYDFLMGFLSHLRSVSTDRKLVLETTYWQRKQTCTELNAFQQHYSPSTSSGCSSYSTSAMEPAVLRMPNNRDLTVDTPSNEDSPDNTTPNKAAKHLQYCFYTSSNLCYYACCIAVVFTIKNERILITKIKHWLNFKCFLIFLLSFDCFRSIYFPNI